MRASTAPNPNAITCGMPNAITFAVADRRTVTKRSYLKAMAQVVATIDGVGRVVAIICRIN